MIQDDKRELYKAQEHAFSLLHIIDSLRDEVMSPRRYAETMDRLRTQAGLMARRLADMTGREISIFDKMNFDKEIAQPPAQAGSEG